MMYKEEEWLRVPPKGTYVVADHPITTANPYRIFCVDRIESSHGRIFVGGRHTIAFSVRMVRAPTEAEIADESNFAPDEL